MKEELLTGEQATQKILVITGFPPTSAPEADHAYRLCEHLAAAGCRVDVLTTHGSVTASHPSVSVHRVMRDWSWRELPRLALALRQLRPDAVLLVYAAWIYQHHPMITFAPTLAKRLSLTTPFITLFDAAYGALVGDCYTRPVRAARKVAARWAGGGNVDYNFGTLLRDSDQVLALADEHLKTLARHDPGLNGKGALLPVAPLIRIHPEDGGATRRRGREWLGVAPDDFLIAYFGYLYPAKGVETLFRAFLIALDKAKNIRLALIGGMLDQVHQDDSRGYVSELKRLAVQLGIAERVTWVGGFDHDDERASIFLRAADACVLPFDSGVQLNHSSFATAAAHGLPIITTKVETTSASFKDGENVLLCHPKDPASMATAINALSTKPELRACLRQGVLRLAEESFSWDKAVKILLTACGSKTR